MQSFDAKKANLHVGVTRKSCIFKEGDDLRQDILALQIIEFFLKVCRVLPYDVYQHFRISVIFEYLDSWGILCLKVSEKQDFVTI